jgi:hypothetical protein
MENRPGLRRFDIGLEPVDKVKEVAIPCSFGANTGRRQGGLVTCECLEPVADDFFHMPEIGKRLRLPEPVGWFRERQRGRSGAFGHGKFRVQIEENIAALAENDKVFSPSGEGFTRRACDIFAQAFVTEKARTCATRKHPPCNAAKALSKTGCFALKQSLGERHVSLIMLARFLDFATSC